MAMFMDTSCHCYLLNQFNFKAHMFAEQLLNNCHWMSGHISPLVPEQCLIVHKNANVCIICMSDKLCRLQDRYLNDICLNCSRAGNILKTSNKLQTSLLLQQHRHITIDNSLYDITQTSYLHLYSKPLYVTYIFYKYTKSLFSHLPV